MRGAHLLESHSSPDELRYGIGLWSPRSDYGPLGLLLWARSNLGLRTVLLGESQTQLQADLAQRFPAAQIQEQPDSPDSSDSLLDAQSLERLTREPWDAIGTPFAHRVWQALCLIPRGQTRSYGELAQSLGLPRHARAVARACASNPLALIIPCHRVLGAQGQLSGYRWGVERKRYLLAMESAIPPTQG